MHIVVFVTCANREEARKIARALLEKKLAACVNIVGNIASFFWWEKKIDSAAETLLILKSNKACLSKIIKLVKSLHSYEVPEIIALPIIGGDKKYLNWIDASLR
ncbi:MAG: divalent-cation tolerance protein CutA [Candidatus Omnitrophota bacterium]